MPQGTATKVAKFNTPSVAYAFHDAIKLHFPNGNFWKNIRREMVNGKVVMVVEWMP